MIFDPLAILIVLAGAGICLWLGFIAYADLSQVGEDTAYATLHALHERGLKSVSQFSSDAEIDSMERRLSGAVIPHRADWLSRYHYGRWLAHFRRSIGRARSIKAQNARVNSMKRRLNEL